MITVTLEGYEGDPRSLMSWNFTATGVVVHLKGALADAINANIPTDADIERLRALERLVLMVEPPEIGANQAKR